MKLSLTTAIQQINVPWAELFPKGLKLDQIYYLSCIIDNDQEITLENLAYGIYAIEMFNDGKKGARRLNFERFATTLNTLYQIADEPAKKTNVLRFVNILLEKGIIEVDDEAANILTSIWENWQAGSKGMLVVQGGDTGEIKKLRVEVKNNIGACKKARVRRKSTNAQIAIKPKQHGDVSPIADGFARIQRGEDAVTDDAYQEFLGNFSQALSRRTLCSFVDVDPSDFAELNWSKRKEKDRCLNAHIHKFNQIAYSVARDILSVRNLIERARMYKFYLDVHSTLLRLGDIDTAHAVHTAFNMTAIYNLKDTKSCVEKLFYDVGEEESETGSYLKEQADLHSSRGNFCKLREQNEKAIIPFIGTYLTDFTFSQDGNAEMMVRVNNMGPSLSLILAKQQHCIQYANTNPVDQGLFADVIKHFDFDVTLKEELDDMK